MERVHIDVQTRSRAALKAVGEVTYARHHTTRVLFVSYAYDDGMIRCWEAASEGESFPEGLRRALADPAVRLNFWWSKFPLAILRETLGLEVPDHRFIVSTSAIASEEGFSTALSTAIGQIGNLGFDSHEVDSVPEMAHFSIHFKDGSERRYYSTDAWRRFKIASICKVGAQRAIYRRFMPKASDAVL